MRTPLHKNLANFGHKTVDARLQNYMGHSAAEKFMLNRIKSIVQSQDEFFI